MIAIKNKKLAKKALGLCSGGLDSILSTVLLMTQGIKVYLVFFETPFFSSCKARYAARENNVPIFVFKITDSYLRMMKEPNTKFGKNMNPCINCHSLMLKLAGKLMFQLKFDFLFTGEVVGQRPMSQNKYSLRYVEKHSGFDGYILRPLSAKLLPKTILENKNKVNRTFFLNISGRSRKPQMNLANRFGIKNFPAPAGGCLLTDKFFTNKLKSILKYLDSFSKNYLYLLKLGRHFNLGQKIKLIVARNEQESNNIERYVNLKYDIILKVCDFPGPVGILQGVKLDILDIFLVIAGSICAGYSKYRDLQNKNLFVKIKILLKEDKCKYLRVNPISPFESRRYLIS